MKGLRKVWDLVSKSFEKKLLPEDIFLGILSGEESPLPLDSQFIKSFEAYSSLEKYRPLLNNTALVKQGKSVVFMNLHHDNRMDIFFKHAIHSVHWQCNPEGSYRGAGFRDLMKTFVPISPTVDLCFESLQKTATYPNALDTIEAAKSAYKKDERVFKTDDGGLDSLMYKNL